MYASEDASKIKDLNSPRRIAGEQLIFILLKTIDQNVLSTRLELLRDGKRYKFDLPLAHDTYFSFDIIGGCNHHGSIVFEDGKIWLARFRLLNRNEALLEEKTLDRRSEFAAYKFLANTATPVPHDYNIADDSDPQKLVRGGYIL